MNDLNYLLSDRRNPDLLKHSRNLRANRVPSYITRDNNKRHFETSPYPRPALNIGDRLRAKNLQKNKLQDLKLNLFVNSGLKTACRKDKEFGFLNCISSPYISDNLKAKFSDIYNQAVEQKFNKDFKTVPKTNKVANADGGREKLNSKRQEIYEILDGMNPDQKNVKGRRALFKVDQSRDRQKSNLKKMRSSSAEFVLQPQPVERDNTERITKMKSKLERLINGEFNITPYIEGEAYNGAHHNRRQRPLSRDSDINLVELLEKKDNSSVDTKKISDLDVLSYNFSDMKSELRSPKINFLEFDSSQSTFSKLSPCKEACKKRSSMKKRTRSAVCQKRNHVSVLDSGDIKNLSLNEM